ncbi:bifunctional NAD(P)H-hydrate repair enzyme Nnr [Nitrospira sp.]|nr:bifunctional NAD(P)H-hydrate repair enzyme Nnr [Nitrospira sp.]
MNVVTAAQMQAIDRRAIEKGKIPSLTLMERAGSETVAAMEAHFGPLRTKRIVIVCGKGHNGGDGLVVARLLKHRKAKIRVVLLHPISNLARDTRTMHRRLVRGGNTALITATPAPDELAQALDGADILVDALLGTGLSSPVSGIYRSAIEALNGTGRPIVAIDLPSGLDADTGHVLGAAVRATLTVTMGLPKYGLYLGEGIDYSGTVRIADIGIPAAYAQTIEGSVSLLTGDTIAGLIPTRRPSSHKGTFGHVGIIAGSPGKTGAAALAARAALRVGSGLVTVATPAGVNSIVEGKLLEAMSVPISDTPEHAFGPNSLQDLLTFARTKSAVAVGPGIGTHAGTIHVIRDFLPRCSVPCVVDADALNAIAEGPEMLSRCSAALILTPHPGEMARLARLDSGRAVNRDRLGIAREFAKTHGVIVVLKGARTVIAHPDGQTAISPSGNPGLATGGTGDVLTGMIGGFLAQGLRPWEAACAGAYLHGLAGDVAAEVRGQASMIAGDVIEHIAHAFGQVTN